MKKKIAGMIICCCITASGIAGYFMYQKKAEQTAIFCGGKQRGSIECFKECVDRAGCIHKR